MNNRKYQTNPSDLLAQGQAIMSSSDESKYLFRVFAVNMVLSGTPASKVAILLFVMLMLPKTCMYIWLIVMFKSEGRSKQSLL